MDYISKVEIENTVYDIKDRSPVIEYPLFMGDSFAVGWTKEGTSRSWIYYMVKNDPWLKDAPDPEAWNNVTDHSTDRYSTYCLGGYGFFGNAAYQQSYNKLLNEFITGHPDRLNQVTILYINGGVNDRGVNESSFHQSVKDFMELARASFPLLKKIVVCYTGIAFENQTDRSNEWTNYRRYTYYCGLYGAEVVDVMGVLHRYDWISARDQIHPMPLMQQAIASAFRGKNVNDSSVPYFTPENGITANIGLGFGDRQAYFILSGSINFNPTVTLGSDGGSKVKLCSTGLPGLTPMELHRTRGFVATSAGKYYEMTFSIYLDSDGGLYLVGQRINSTGAGYETISNITYAKLAEKNIIKVVPYWYL